MMIYSLNESKQIKSETFFQIVKAIYFKYYQRWHNLFVGSEEKLRYEKELNTFISKMEKELISKKTIDINGLNSLFPVITNFNERKNKRMLKIIIGIVLFLLSFIFVGIGYTFFQKKMGWDSSTLNTIVTLSFAMALFLVAIIFENRSNLFSKNFEKLIEKF